MLLKCKKIYFLDQKETKMETKPYKRNNSLDWLRVLGILFVFIYHTTRLYNVEDWSVKNVILSNEYPQSAFLLFRNCMAGNELCPFFFFRIRIIAEDH